MTIHISRCDPHTEGGTVQVATARPSTAGFHAEPDPIFLLDSSVAFRVPARIDAETALRKLELRISRDPQDLLSHVRRILVLTDVSDPEALFSAMVDLYLALGNQGLALRSLLLEIVAEYLPADEHAYLEQRLEDGLRAKQRLPITSASRLSPGLIGSPTMVREPDRSAYAAPVQGSALDTARQLLEDGDLDSARLVLEDALVDSPDDADVAAELYEIHRRLRDRAAIESLNARLQARGAALPEGWAHLLADH